MHCCLWFRSVFRVRGPWPKPYGYHLSIIIIYYIVSLLIKFNLYILFYILLTVHDITPPRLKNSEQTLDSFRGK